jgi:organic radical activating enzyme
MNYLLRFLPYRSFTELVLPKSQYIKLCNPEIQEHILLKDGMRSYLEKNYYIDNMFGYNIEQLELRNIIHLSKNSENQNDNQNEIKKIKFLYEEIIINLNTRDNYMINLDYNLKIGNKYLKIANHKIPYNYKSVLNMNNYYTSDMQKIYTYVMINS